MLQSFLTAFNVILPICVMLICGAALKKTGYLTKELSSGINKLIFRLFLPASLFNTCYNGVLDAAGNMKLIFFCALSLFIIFLLFIPIVSKCEKENARRSVMLQAVFRGNLSMFGIPVLTLLYGPENLSVMAILLAFIIPELNVLAVLCFEVFSGYKANWHVVLLRILKNPLIDAIGLGILFNVLHIELPAFVTKSVSTMAAVTTPMAFVLLGASFSIVSAKHNYKALAVMLSGKLIVLPLAALSLGLALGMRGPALASAIVLFGSPVAVSSIPMSEDMGGDVALANEGVLLSSLLGIFTMFALIFCISLLGFL